MFDRNGAQNFGGNSRAISRLFLAAFLSSCFWFWWLLSIVYREVLNIDDPVSTSMIGVSILSAALFSIGFLLPHYGKLTLGISSHRLNRCEAISYKLTLLLFAPAITLALAFAITTAGTTYGEGAGLSAAYQIVFYVHLFFGFMFLGVVDGHRYSKRKIWLAMFLIVLPRLVVSLHYGRVFLAQGIVPVVFIGVARGFIELSWKRLVQIGAVGLFILIVPSITRGDNVFNGGNGQSQSQGLPPIVQWLAAGSSLQVTQDFLNLDLSQRCPPLLVSFTDKLFPYTLFDVCTVTVNGQTRSANVDRLVTHELLGDSGDGGTGTSYLLELFLTGGLAAVVLGSFAFGFVCRSLTTSLAARSVFSGIWAECLMRAVFAPRSMLGYVFEKVPGLVLATICVVIITVIFDRKFSKPVVAISTTRA